jgi:spore germination protein
VFKSKGIFTLIVLTLFLTGCGQQRILERLAFIDVMGQDLIQNEEEEAKDLILVTLSIPLATPEGKISREVMSLEAETVKIAKQSLARQTDLLLVSGQTRNLLFGKELAKKGLWEHIDTFIRDPVFSGRVRVVVVDGSASKLLAKDYPEHPRVGSYIDHLLRKEAEVENIPDVTIYEFVRDYYDDGIEPVAPIISQLEDNIEAAGVALFQKDRYIGSISADDILIFSLLRDEIKRGEISIHLEQIGAGNHHVMFSSIVGSRGLKVVEADAAAKRFRVNLNIRLRGTITEYTGELDLRQKQDRIKLEQMLERYFEQKAQRLIQQLQQLQADNLGIGKFVRNRLSYKEWKQLDWHEVFPMVDIRCKVKVKIEGTGIFS